MESFTFTDNVEFSIKFIPRVELKKGREYLQFTDVKLDFTTTRLHMQFTNLFNGDKLLGESTNKFLNENWSDILNELKPVLKKAIGNIINGVVGPFFAKFPYDELFLWSHGILLNYQSLDKYFVSKTNEKKKINKNI